MAKLVQTERRKTTCRFFMPRCSLIFAIYMAKLVQTECRKNDLSIFMPRCSLIFAICKAKLVQTERRKTTCRFFYAEVQPNLRYYKAKLQIKNGNSVVVCLFSSNLRTGDGDLGWNCKYYIVLIRIAHWISVRLAYLCVKSYKDDITIPTSKMQKTISLFVIFILNN